MGHGTAGDMINDISEEDNWTGQVGQWFGNEVKKWNSINTNIGNFCKNKNMQLVVELTVHLRYRKRSLDVVFFKPTELWIIGHLILILINGFHALALLSTLQHSVKWII